MSLIAGISTGVSIVVIYILLLSLSSISSYPNERLVYVLSEQANNTNNHLLQGSYKIWWYLSL
jgi:hypothetical protein